VSVPDSGLRRVAVHADTVHADLALPAGVPVATLIASVVDLMARRDGPHALRPHRLGLPGRAPLDSSQTLAQQGIRDGAVLVLTRADDLPATPRFDDPAEQVAAMVRATACPWSPVARRLTAVLTASGLAGVAGFVAVPGGRGTPNALLAVAAAGTVAVSAVPSSGCSGSARAVLCCLAGLSVAAAVVGMACAATGISLQAVGAVAAAGATVVVRAAGRIALVVGGLSRRPAADRTGRARDLLSGLVAGSAAAVVLGSVGVAAGQPVAGVPRLVGAAFAATAGAVLLLRARSHTDGWQIAALVTGGVVVLGVAVLSAAVDAAPHRVWPAAVAAALSGAAVVLGFTAPAGSPLLRRGAELLEGVALGALVPLACWLCGVYGAARGLGLG
jgi:hypothetical protein